MGLKQASPKTASAVPPADEDVAADKARAEAAAAAEQAAADKVAAEEAEAAKTDTPKANKGKTLQLRAVHRMISDPMTGVVYDTDRPRPGIVKEGNWLHAQIVAGILKEYVQPGLEEGDDE